MRRRLVLALVVPLCLGGSPASAERPVGELVVVANGPASGSVTLPGGTLRIDAWRAQTRSPSVGLVLSRDGRFGYGLVARRDESGGDEGVGLGDPLPGGRYDLHLVTAAPVTLRVAIEGMRGRAVVRLRTPLRGGTLVHRAVGTPGTYAEDAIDFATKGPTFLVHAVTFRTAPARAGTFCVRPRDVPCTEPYVVGGEASPAPGSLMTWDHAWSADGPARATFRSLHPTEAGFDGVHTVLAVPYG